MKSLEEHNRDVFKDWLTVEELQEPHPNGIACPICKHELMDSNPRVVLASLPPQYEVHCPKCGYKGNRL